MQKRKNILIALALMCMTFTSVNASSLVQMDIQKASANDIDVTFYTTEVSESPMVTRKSNNKYVILMPNVSGQNAGTPDLSAVKDIITNVDVKNVDDGMSGYTKVTFITTKPLNIKTHMQKAAPVTQEEKAAKAIIAQVKTHPKQMVAPVAPKKEVAKTTVTSSVATAKPKAQVKIENIPKTSEKVVNIAPPKVDTKIGEKFSEIFDDKMQPIEQLKNDAETALVSDEKFDIKEVEKIEKISQNTEKNQKRKNHSGWAIVVLPLLGLYLLAKMARNSIQKSIALKASFKENLAEQPISQENYDDIINASDLNWQERYQRFVEESRGEIKNRKYTFITTKEDTLTDVDQKRLELENTLSKTPEIYEPLQIDISEDTVPEVVSEDELIQEELSSLKLKAFAKPASLQKTPKVTEGKFIKLQQTALNSSSRRFRNANLRVSDLISTGSKYLQENSVDAEMIEKEQNYIMSSIDEYFALLDKEQTRKVTNPNGNLSSKVAASLAKVKPSIGINNQTPSPSRVSNPMAKKSTNDHLSGLIVKDGYTIDENRGFYLVNLDGVSALVGRVNEEIFVLKKFNSSVDKLQVRHDSESVYMVKAGSFKSLVDVDETKMGVLIEL